MRDPDTLAERAIILMVAIRRATLYYFWSRDPVTVMWNLTMVKGLRKVAREEMGLDEWLTPMGTYSIQY